MESGWKPNVEISPNCPRCGSSNTKFCYYNNYSLTQPRYFCKGCRRYWTKGGSLRNVPVGGGCRKNRRGNKTLLRSQSNIDGLTFKNSPNCDNSGASTTIDNPIWHSYDLLPRRTTNSSSSHSSSDGPNIDLALVYANFLNQKPHPGGGVGLDHDNHLDQIQTAFDPNSIEKSRLISNTEVVGPSTLPAEELGLTGCSNIITQQQPSTEVIEPHFVGEGNNNQLYCSEFNNSMQTLQNDRSDQQCGNHDGVNFELPPLPGEEEEASHDDVMWSNSEMMMINHPFHQVTQQQPLLGPQIHDDDDADLLIGNWSPFDLPTRDSSFSRP